MRRVVLTAVHPLVLLGFLASGAMAQQAPSAAEPRDARVRVTVLDSLFDLQPLRGAEVLLESASSSLFGLTDSTGAVVLQAPTNTRYRLTFFHPRLERLGLSGKVISAMITGDTALVLATPPAVQVRAALCGADASGESSALVGAVTDSAANPVAGAVVRVGWKRWTIQGATLVPTTDNRETRTNSAGRYTLCDVPADGVLTWRVTARGSAPLLAYANAQERPVVELSARFAAAQPELSGTAAAPKATELDATLVTARANEDRTGFDRRRLTWPAGRFFTAQDIERRRPISTLDIFRGYPGLNVIPSCGGMCNRILIGRSIGGRGAEGDVCQPVLFVDGVRLPDPDPPIGPRGILPHPFDQILNPQDIRGIEVYNGPASIPPAYASKGSECGAILVWTKLRS